MRKWIILVVLVVIIAILGYNYMYQEHRNVATEKAAYSFTATSLSEEFQINPKASEFKYLDKIIQVSGTISSADEKTLTLNNVVFCQFSIPIATNTIKIDDPLVIKGRFIGYDDLLEEIKLDQCQIIN